MYKHSKNDIGRTIKRLRLDKGITQRDLAVLLETTQQTVARWETGEAQPDLDTFFHICDIFHVSDILKTFGYASDPAPVKPLSYADLDPEDRLLADGYVDGLLANAKYRSRDASAG